MEAYLKYGKKKVNNVNLVHSPPPAVIEVPITVLPDTIQSLCEYRKLKYIDSSTLIDPNMQKYFYNACLLKNNRLFYRVGKEPKGYEDRIATCMLDIDLQVIPDTNRYIDVYSNWNESARTTLLKSMVSYVFKNGEHVEDPRAILVGNNYFVFYTDGLTIGVAKLNFNCDTIYSHYLFLPSNKYEFKHSDGREKNWIPFLSNGKMYILYGTNPVTYFECLDIGTQLKINNVFQLGYQISWPYGYVRGSAPPANYDSKTFLWVFHSTMPFPSHAKKMSIHYMFSVYVTNNTFPFEIIKMCKLPLLIGIPSHASGTLSLQHNVVYPCGIINIENGWRISMGINDYEIAFLDVTEQDFLW